MKLSKVAKKVIIDNYTILIGKSAEMNDILTTEIANPNDLWFHASGVPGSHVVINLLDEQDRPPINIIKEAARLAAINSKGIGKINVVYTEAKYVTKTNKHNIGQVTVDYSKSKIIKIFSK